MWFLSICGCTCYQIVLCGYRKKMSTARTDFSLSLSHFPKDAGGGMAVSDGSVISYSPQTDRDYGTLLCWARNDIGEQREPCVYRIFLGGLSLYLFPLYCPHPVASQLLVDGQRANGLYKLRVSLRLSSVYLVSVSFFVPQSKWIFGSSILFLKNSGGLFFILDR